MRKYLLLAALPLGLLTGCESMPNPYPNGPGFYRTAIDATHARITYVVPPKMTREKAEDTLLLRAAEDTLEKGHTWFRITGRTRDVDRSQPRSSLSIGTGTTSFGRRSSVGVGVGTTIDLSGGPREVLGVEIVMGDGVRPGDPDVYDAADVARTIRARLGVQP
jgi:hypothetical protein